MSQEIQGLFTLKKILLYKREDLKLFSTLEGRLLENLHAARLVNAGQDMSTERSLILQELDKLAQLHCGQTFHQLSVASSDSDPVPPVETLTLPQISSDQQEIAAAPWPDITYELATHVIPVSYYKNTDSSEIPFITFLLNNSHPDCSEIHIYISISIEGFSSGEAGQEIRMVRGEKTSVTLQPIWSASAIKNLDKPQQANLNIDIHSLHTPQEKRHLTERIYLHAYNTAILAKVNAQGKFIDLTHALSSWVTPYQAAIEQALSLTIENYKLDHKFPGYNISGTSQERAQGVLVQVKALFEMLKHQIRLHYVPSALTFTMDNRQVIQRVRLPAETLTNGGSANCLDGTVLFASLLELASIYPAIVLIPGHAFVAWKPLPEEENRYECLETTFIRDRPFEIAVRHANQSLAKARQRQDFSRPLFDPSGFARLIDIAQCRARGITPLE